MKYKNVLSITFCFLFSLSIMLNNYAEDVDVNAEGSNIDYGDWRNHNVGDANLYYCNELSGARVSLINIEDSIVEKCIDMCDFSKCSYENLCKYRVLSNYTKLEIIALNKELTDDMVRRYMYEPLSLSHNLCETSITFPDFLARAGSDAETRINNVKNYFKNESRGNLEKILNCFYIGEEEIQLWKDNKLCLLIEPLVGVHTNDETDNLWVMTCAEYGLLAVNGDALPGCRFASGKLSGSVYKALPYGIFKENDGLITSIRAFSNDIVIDHACNCMSEWEQMITTLGCFEVSSMPSTARVVEYDATIEYYTNSWVITSVNVSSSRGFPYQSDSPGWAECSNGAKSNCLNGGLAKITFSFDSNVSLNINTYTQSIAIPENGNALSWVKWKCPPVACSVEIDITTNSSDAIPDNNKIYINVIDPTTDKYPPNTEATDRNDYFRVPTIADGSWNIGNQTSLSWTTYNYNWHYDWHCICRETSHGEMCENEISLSEYNEYGSSGGWDYEETDSGGKKKVYWNDCNTCSCNYSESVSDNHTCKHCTFSKEDWGWVEWTAINHEVSLNTSNIVLKRSSNSPDTNNSDYSIKSGYGIELNLDSQIKYKKNGSTQSISSVNSYVCPPQYMEMFLPEHNFETYEITNFNDLGNNGYKENNSFNLPINPYSQFKQNCHFTPIWYPDGKYVVGIKISQAFCPAGMLYVIVDDKSINIEGNAYDDWHIAPEMN